MSHLLGSIEGGGTKINCAVGYEDGTIIKQIQFPTTTPQENVKQMVDFFQKYKVKSIGIGFFGPLNVNRQSPEYGCLLDTPKRAWRFYPLLANLKKELSIPMGIHSDVTLSSLGEASLGGGRDSNKVLYVTVGTGIGGGVVVNGKFEDTSRHPEMGHVTVQRAAGDKLESVCSFHKNCMEGLAAGPAIEKRWGRKGADLPSTHPAWEMEADYIAQGLVQMIFVLAPDCIILGGGVMKQAHLFEEVRKKVKQKLHDYTYYEQLKSMDTFITKPQLGDNSGLIGGLLLAAMSLSSIID